MHTPLVAYFSMEICLDPQMPTYSGGLGVLAGDTLRAAADLKLPIIAFTLLHRKGYFRQKLDASGRQTEEEVAWQPEHFVSELKRKVSVTIEGRTVWVTAWRYDLKSSSGNFMVPVFLLDTDLPENSASDRTLTHWLYGGDARYRLAQEVILGIGGKRMLRELGYTQIARYHMNEGHASLLALELLDEEANSRGKPQFDDADIEAVQRKCVFTTHTPVAAGHDQFPEALVNQVIGRPELFRMHEVFCCEGALNMTYLGLNLSHYVNGVAKRHGEVSRELLAPKRRSLSYDIDSITNGVHATSWTTPPFSRLFDHYIPGWRADNASLRYALNIPKQAIWRAHLQAKEALINYINQKTGCGFDADAMTLGFGRRAAAYKRMDLLFRDPDRIRRLSSGTRPLQIVYAGKAHPRDEAGKQLIQRVFQAMSQLRGAVQITYLNDYDATIAQILAGGVDVWLNTPQPPHEASGTSGMKAALNGVPSLSVLDGWWLEGCIEGVTGWAIGDSARDRGHETQDTQDADSLYDKLEHIVIPLFYDQWEKFVDVMRQTIALNGSFFNAQRMLQQYVTKAYFL